MADQKISALTEIDPSAVADGDWIPVVDSSAGTTNKLDFGTSQTIYVDDATAFFASNASYTSGTYVRTRAEGFAYRAVDTATATTVENAGLQAFEVVLLLGEYVIAEAFGIPEYPVDGTTQMEKLFAAADNIKFTGGKYLITSNITKAASNVTIDFGPAEFVNDGPVYMFTFGTVSDTPVYENVTISGGIFSQEDAATTDNRNYIALAGIDGFTVTNLHMNNVSNGGLFVRVGCQNGVINNPVAIGKTNYSPSRAIWVSGGDASDYATQLVDTDSFTRNATALPAFAPSNITINDPFIRVEGYGIYLINTRDVSINNPDIDISGGQRCIAINNYSPRCKVTGGRLKSDDTSTGILVTQFSTEVTIDNVLFEGTFGGGRDIYVQYLSEVKITNCTFNTNSTKQIEQDSGGFSIVRGNTFRRPSGFVSGGLMIVIKTIPDVLAGTGTVGDTATMLPGMVFERNDTFNRIRAIFAEQTVSASGNIPGLDSIVFRDNNIFDLDKAAGGGDFAMEIDGDGTTNKVFYHFFDNVGLPAANANRNAVTENGIGAEEVRTDAQFASYLYSITAGSNSVQGGTKQWGGNFSGNVTPDPTDDTIRVVPRTLGGELGAEVNEIVQVLPESGFDNYRLVRDGNIYTLTLFDGASQVDLSATAVEFKIIFAGSRT